MHTRNKSQLFWATCAVISLSSILAAQDPDASQNQKIRDRYQQVLLANPQPGTAFDKLYKSYADAGEIDLWLTSLADKAKDPAQAAALQLIIGLIHERQGQDAKALQAYALSIQANPKNPKALAAQGLLLAKSGKPLQAAQSLQSAIDLKPPNQDAKNLYKALGRAYAAANQPDNAVKAWLTLAELSPDDTNAREELAGFLIEEARPTEAAAQYEKIRATTTDGYQKVRAVFALAQLQSAQNKPDAAVALLADQLGNLAQDSWLRAETHRRLELAFTRSTSLPGLADFYAKWLAAHPDDTDVRLAQASLYKRLSKPDEALAAYQAALAKNPTRADIRTSLADLLLSQNKRPEAIALYEKAANDEPTNPALWERLAQILLSGPDKNLPGAIAAIKNISDKAPKDPARAVRAAEVFRAANLKDQALEYYTKASQLAPDQPEYDEYAGLYLAQLNERDQALARLANMVKGPRDTPANRLRLAQLLIQLKAFPEALAVLDAAKPASSDPSSTSALSGVYAVSVTLLTELKRYPEAFAALNQLESSADTPQRARDARIARAQLHKSLDTLTQATLDQQAKVKAAPTPDNFEMLAIYLRAQGNRPDAAAAAAQARLTDAQNPARMALAADLYIESNDLLKATAQVRELLAVQPQRKAAYAQSLAQLVAQLTDPEPSLTQAKALIALIPDEPHPYLLLANTQLKLAHPDDALLTLQSAVKQLPNDVSLLLALARLQAATNHQTDAAASFARAADAATDPEQKLQAIVELTRLSIATNTAEPLLQKLLRKARDTDYEPGPTLALVSAYREAGQLDKAQSTLEEALLRRPTDAQTLQLLVQITRQQGNRQSALQYATRLQTLKPSDQQLAQQIAELLFESGRPREAVTQWQSAQSMSLSSQMSPADLALQHARVLSQEGKTSQAVLVLIQAVDIFPDNWSLAMEAGRLAKQAGRLDQAAAIFDKLMRLPVPPDAKNNSQAQFPNISYLGFKGRAPIANQWINLRNIQTRCITEINLSIGPQNSRTSGAVMRYAPPDLPSAQLAALIHRLHIAEQDGLLSAYLRQLAQEAGYILPDMRAGTKLTPNPTRPAQIRLLQTFLLLNLTADAQSAAQSFVAKDPAFTDALTLSAIFTVASAVDARNALIPGATPASPKDAQAAIASLESAAPQAIPDIASLAAEAYLSRGQTDLAKPWLDLTLKSPPSPEARLSLLGTLVRARDNTYALTLLPALAADTKALAIDPQNQAFSEIFSDMSTLAGQALRPDSPALGIDLAVASLDLLTTPAGRVWLQAQNPQPIFNVEDPKAFTSARPQPSTLVPTELFDILQSWSTQASIQPRMQSDLVTRVEKWSQTVPAPQKPVAAAVAATLFRFGNLADDALKTLQTADTSTSNPELKLLLVQALTQQKKFDQAKAALAAIPPSADPLAARQIALARLHLAMANQKPDDIKQALAQIDPSQSTPREKATLDTLRKQNGLPVLTPPSPTGAGPANPVANKLPTPSAAPATPGQTLAAMRDSSNFSGLESYANRLLKDESPAVLANMSFSEEVTLALAMLARINRLDATIQAAVKDWESQPDDPDTCARLLVLYNATGQETQAELVLAKLIATSPSQMAMRYHYAMLLHGQSRLRQATPHLVKVITSQPRLIQSGQEIIDSFQYANRIPALMSAIATIGPADKLFLTQNNTSPPFDWLIESATLLAPESPKSALILWQKYQSATGEAFPRDSARFSPNPIQLALRTNDTQALIQQITLSLAQPTKSPITFPPDPGAGAAPASIPWVFIPYDPTAGASSLSPIVEAFTALNQSNQLDSLAESLPAADDKSAKAIAPRILRAMIAGAQSDPAPAQALLADTALIQNRANDPYIAALALALDANEKTAGLAGELATAVIKTIPASRNQLLTPTDLALLDIAARHPGKDSTVDAPKLYARLFTPPVGPPSQTAPMLALKLKYIPSALKAGADAPALKFLLHASAVNLSTGPQPTSNPAFAQSQSLLKSALPPILALPHVQTLLKAQFTQAQANPDTAPADLIHLALLTNQLDPILTHINALPVDATGKTDFNAGLISQAAYALAQANQPTEARALILKLIQSGQPHRLRPMADYPKTFPDADSLTQLAHAIQTATPLVKQNPLATDWLRDTLNFMTLAPRDFTGKLDQAHEATLKAHVAGLSWRRSPVNGPFLLFQKPKSLPTELFIRYLSDKKYAQAYDFYSKALFAPDTAGQIIPVDEMFTSQPKSVCPASTLVRMALTLNKTAELTQLANDTLADQDSQDQASTYIAQRILLLIAIQQDDTKTALSLLSKSFPNPAVIQELGYDPSLTTIVMACLDKPDLIQPALDLYIQCAQLASLNETGYHEARLLQYQIVGTLRLTGHADLVPPFQEKLKKLTNWPPIPTDPPAPEPKP
jgi:tetratricopeptide (TPR) repeat protein